MKKGIMDKVAVGAGIVAAFLEPVSGADAELRLTRDDGLYPAGEEIVAEARWAGEGDAWPLTVRVTRDWTQRISEDPVVLDRDFRPVFGSVPQQPASFQIELLAGEVRLASIGAVSAPEAIKPAAPEPADFDAFWAGRKELIKNGPQEPALTPFISEKIPAGYLCFDAEIPCSTSTPARGYFIHPADAAEKSLPAVIFLHAAGVSAEWCLSRPETALRYARMGKGALVLDLNAHGMKNGQPREYYQELDTQLKGYAGFGLDSPDTWYYTGMYMRLLAAIDFICRQPEWDGKRLLLIGESQGGGQALAGAGLDPRVSHVLATVPALCDFAGTLHGRKGGFPDVLGWGTDPETKARHARTVAYCDNAYLSARSRAVTLAETGLMDSTCPPTSVLAAYNAIPGEKTLLTVPFRAHQLNSLPPDLRSRYDAMAGPVKTRFLNDFFGTEK